MSEAHALAALARRLASPHMVLASHQARAPLLRDLAHRLDKLAASLDAKPPAPPVVITGVASVRVERRTRARQRVMEKLDPMLELKRLLREEQAEA